MTFRLGVSLAVLLLASPAMAVPQGTPNANGIGALAISNALSELVPVAAQARANLAILGMALQAPNAVAITGGAINGTTIGGTTPAPATVSTLTTTGDLMAGGGSNDLGLGRAIVVNAATGTPGIIVQRAGNVVMYLSGDGSSYAQVLSGGNFPLLLGPNNTATLKLTSASTQSTVPLDLLKLSAAPTGAPGATHAQLFLTAGTTAGTCKLQMTAGTSATPVTILDNVGAGC